MFLEKNKTAIKEAYFTKNPKLLEAEKHLDNFRQRMFKEGDESVITKLLHTQGLGKVYTDPDFTKFVEYLEDAFGFKGICLEVLRTGMVNAFTIPASMRIPTAFNNAKKRRGNIVKTSTGIKFKKEAEAVVYIIITTGLLFREDLSSGEILAILIHEIGHNFSDYLNGFSGMLLLGRQIAAQVLNEEPETLLVATIKTIVIGELFNLAANLNHKLHGEQKKINDYIYLALGLYISSSVILSLIFRKQKEVVVNGIKALAGTVTKKDLNTKQSALRFYSSLAGYYEEVRSDEFVTLYGYGPELSSGLLRMTNDSTGYGSVEYFVTRVPILGAFFGTLEASAMLIGHLIDPHPDTYSRIEDNIKILERELKTNTYMSDKTRKQIKKDIEDMKNTTKEVESEYKTGGKYATSYSNAKVRVRQSLEEIIKTAEWRKYILKFLTKNFKNVDLLSNFNDTKEK